LRRRIRATAELKAALVSLLWIELCAEERTPADRAIGAARGYISWELIRALDDEEGERRLHGWARDRLARLDQWTRRHTWVREGSTEQPDALGDWSRNVADVAPGDVPAALLPPDRSTDPALHALLDVLVLFNGDRDRWRTARLRALRTGAWNEVAADIAGRPELRAEHDDLRRGLQDLVGHAASTAPPWPTVLQPSRVAPRVASWMTWHSLDLAGAQKRGMRREAADVLVAWGYSEGIYNGISAYLQQIDPLARAAIAHHGASP